MSTSHVDASSSRSGDREQLALPANGIRTFVIVSCGQFIAVTGVTLFNFAAAFYVYRKYSLLVVGIVYALPFLMLVAASPFTGSLVDRWGARRALLVSNMAGILLVCTLVLVPLTGALTVWHGFVIVLAVPLIKALLLPAFETAVPFLVPKRHIGRANGTRMLVNGTGAVLGPVVAVLLLDAIGIYGVGVVACLSLVLGILTLLPVHIPRALREDASSNSPRALLADFRQAWQYVRARHGLPALLVFFGVTSFGIGVVEVLLPRLVLAFASVGELDVVLIVGLAGMVITGLAMTVWGGPRRRVSGLLGYSLLFAVAMVLGSLRPSIALIAIAAFVFLGSTSIIIGNVQTILHTKVEPHLQGRVMGLKNAFYGILLMLGNILAGLGGGILQPLIGTDHAATRAVARMLGGGPGREFALLMLVVGAAVALCVLLAYRHSPLRHLEDRLPDVTPEDLALEAARQ
jgi:hypothetical protein